MSRNDGHQSLTLARVAHGHHALLGPMSDITLVHAITELFRIDKFLFAIVVVFGVVFPFLKAIISALCWYYFDLSKIERCLEILSYMAKLSMLDVMLLAFFVVAFKGLGLGTVEVKYGLYVYASLVIASLLLNLAMRPSARAIRLQQGSSPT